MLSYLTEISLLHHSWHRYSPVRCMGVSLALLGAIGLQPSSSAQEISPAKQKSLIATAYQSVQQAKDETTTEEKQEAPKPKQVQGVFSSRETIVLSLTPETWSSFKVLKAIPHGSIVRQGQVVLQFDPQDITKAIEKAEREMPRRIAKLEKAEQELILERESMVQSLELAKRTLARAQHELEYFKNVDRQQSIKSAEMSLLSSQYRLENAQEELKQLEQMYLEDDLTEQTEEIILKRAKREVQMSEFSFQSAQLRAERTLKVFIPREFEDLQSRQLSATLANEKAQIAEPFDLRTRELAIEDQKRSIEEAEKKLNDLNHDRQMMSHLAPDDGIIYYGEFDQGKLKNYSTVRKMLKKGGSASTNVTLMTFIPKGSRSLFVTTSVSEADLSKVQKGQQVQIVPTSQPELEIDGMIEQINFVPDGSGQYLVEVAIPALEQGERPIYPGMTCKVVLPISEQGADDE